MPLSPAGLSVLSDAECRGLLAGGEVGRVITSMDAMPAASPVNYRVVDNTIVFRTRPGTKLDLALHDTVVGFEVDELDPVARSGWSVLVVGRSSVVTDAVARARLDRYDIRSWAGIELSAYVVIRIDRVSGRRVPG